MAATLEFGSMYKFVASVGVALCGGAAVVAWASVQENHLLELTRQSLRDLPERPRSTIQTQQGLLSLFVSWWWVISLLLGVAGIILIVWSLRRWKPRQLVTDRTEDRGLEALDRAATAAELDESRQLNVAVALEESKAEAPTATTRAPISQETISTIYSKIESRIAGLLFVAYGNDYQVRRNVVVAQESGAIAIADIVASPLKPDAPTLIFEIKYSPRTPPLARLRAAIDRLSTLTFRYEQAHRRLARGILIYITDDDLPNSARVRLERTATSGPRPIFLTENMLSNISPDDLRNRIDGA